MTQTERNALVVGDIIVRTSNAKLYVVTATFEQYLLPDGRVQQHIPGVTQAETATKDFHPVRAQVMGEDGRGHGRMYTVSLDMFNVGNFGGK